jgi:hypothetical protein
MALALLVGCAEKPDRFVYDTWAAALQDEGRLRADRTPADARFSNNDLVHNFYRIALFTEANPGIASGPNQEATPDQISRWEGPIRYWTLGRGITPKDKKDIRALMDRVETLTGLEIVADREDPNFVISLTTPGERDEASASLGEINTNLRDTFDAWRRSPTWICGAWLGAPRQTPNKLSVAFVFIGDEVTGLSRQSCLEEEIVQSLGLRNDDPKVRPSIFNDDEEFALLTDHDEYLLRILYDRRLRPGMDAREAMPVVREIIAELRPDG